MAESEKLSDRCVAVLATDGFEQSELTEPKRLLEVAGAHVDVIAPGGATQIRGWDKKNWGAAVDVDVALKDARPEDYDALVLPGGVMSPDKLRMDAEAVTFIKSFVMNNKPIAAICHGPWTLIEADAVRGRTMTSWPSLQTDLKNAGAQWVDKEVVEDKGLITSRKPDDLPAFNQRAIELFSRKVHRAAA